ncbi:MAG: hypothetical protein ACTSRU_19530 [Candidatus Hodarchaeales archaeon]
MSNSSVLTENRIVKLVGDYLRANYYIIEEELVINSTVLDIEKLAGQQVLRIDLAAISMLDGSIIFIEAETEAYLDHPMIYRPVADYVYLACPLEKLTVEQTQETVLKDLYQSAARHGIGIMGVYDVRTEGRLPFQLKNNAPLLPLKEKVRSAVLRAFQKRGHTSITKYRPWWRLS